MPSTENSPRRSSPPALAAFRPLVRAIACTIVPEAAAMDEKAWDEFDALMDSALADRPRELRRRLELFLRAIEWLPVIRFGRRFTSLEPAQRARFLSMLENHPAQIIRSGFWGLRTLVLLGYYGRPETVAAIGYAASPRGWEARR
ncbi:MAG: gluconate 2-dehydrogenase subunit 3 family protein [Acidobacteria bacterium]|nr:gluconate 2-dehydrogenase subunit 3 family protein [Acidobacteriota bacterium]